MLTQHEAKLYLDAHPVVKGQRSKWILEAIKHFDGLRWTEIQRLWVTSQGYDYDEMEHRDQMYDHVLDRYVKVGPKSRVHRGRGCDYLQRAHGKLGLLPRYCEKRGNKYHVVQPIVGPWNPDTRWDGVHNYRPAIGEYASKRS